MPLLDTIETHIVGRASELRQWTYYEWLVVAVKILIIIFYFGLINLILLLQCLLHTSTRGKTFRRIIKYNNRIWRAVPFLGDHFIKVLPCLIKCFSENVIPVVDRLSENLQFIYQVHLVQMTFKNKNRVQIVVTGNNIELEQLTQKPHITTLVISNHRSLNDYLLINYLLQNCDKEVQHYKDHLLYNLFQFGRPDVTKINFLSWGSMVNFPSYSFLKNILVNDENVTLSAKNIEKCLKRQGNQVLVTFPEVNILTSELAIVQRKITEEYAFVAKFYNLLYPRFKTFASAVACFASINHIKRQTQNKYIKDGKIYLQSKVEKIVSNINGSALNDSNKTSINQNNLILNGVTYLMKKVEDQNMEDENFTNDAESKRRIVINPYFYDFTIVYYKLKYTTEGHDHIEGNLALHEGYQLEQINPTIFELLRPENQNAISKPPIIAMVQIDKYLLSDIIHMKDKHLSRWLETRWKSKDELIDTMESSVRLR